MMIFARYPMAMALAVTPVVTTAQTPGPVDRFAVPVTVSKEAAATLAAIYRLRSQRPEDQRPQSLADWDRQAAATEAVYAPMSARIAGSLGATVTEDKLGGVPVLRIRPARYAPHGRMLLYAHGGGYTRFSARSSLIVPALIATATGDEVVSIDYTLAPRGTWRSVTDQVFAVWQALLAAGIRPGAVGMIGDSAGGGLVAGSVLKMRDRALPLPGALWLLSPLSDVTHDGDTETTLAAADPILTEATRAWGAAAYAAPADQKNPYVSPAYGDYTKAFPPTLIQAGTRELLLSGAVREYQAIRGGGHDAVLDVYEGMPHVFQSVVATSPETRTAIARAAAFFAARLTP